MGPHRGRWEPEKAAIPQEDAFNKMEENGKEKLRN